MTLFTLAVGDTTWGEKALNLCLSAKANSPKLKVGLVCSLGAIETVSELIEHFFDYVIYVDDLDDAVSGAFQYKTQLYELCEGIDSDIMFLDADTIVLPKNDLLDMYFGLIGSHFVLYCNDMYNTKKGTRKRKDYTFWMDYELCYGEDFNLPQYNSAFMFWRYCDMTAAIFTLANALYLNDELPDIAEIKYKSTRTDELCFNLASHYLGHEPESVPYRPIYMNVFSEIVDLDYIRHQYPVMGFAGEAVYNEGLLNWYNDLVKYYRGFYGVPEWEMSSNCDTNSFRDIDAIFPHTTIDLARIGGFGSVSDGGIINPTAWFDGMYYKVLFRVDSNLNGYKGKKNLARCNPYLATFDRNFKLISVSFVPLWVTALCEDWRVIETDELNIKKLGGSMWDGSKWQQVFWELNLSSGIINPEKVFNDSGKDEKNWAWFSTLIENDIKKATYKSCFHVYSVEPFVIRDFNCLEVARHEFNSGWGASGFIACSTFPVRYGDDYLMWVHKKQKDLTYLNSVMVFDGVTFEPKYFIPSHVLGCDIGQPLYISSCLIEKDRVLLFGGEGGIEQLSNAALSKATVRIIDRELFDNTIKQYPCK